jgi:hypothetical protein
MEISRDTNQQMNAFGTLVKLMIASQTVQAFNGKINKLNRWQARYTLRIWKRTYIQPNTSKMNNKNQEEEA